MAKKFRLTEIQGDLFACPAHFSLGHCVSGDFHMKKGIATEFFAKFNSTYQDLQCVDFGIGDIAVFKDGQRFIYNLITKNLYYHKPTYHQLDCSLHRMRDHMLDNNVTHLALPRLACGLDKLEYPIVKAMIVQCFQHIPCEIRIYTLPQ